MMWLNIRVNITICKIGPKPLQKPRPPILLGGFTPKTFPRIVNYADGWIGVAGFGLLEQLGQMINGLKEETKKFNKEPSGVSVYILAYPNVLDSPSSSTQTRLPMTGTIEQIRSDIEQIEKMGVKHIDI